MNKIGERIAIYRKTNGMTQDQLANVLSVSPQTVSKWETGTTMPDIMLLPVIAEVFEISVDSLFGSNKKAECKSFSAQNISDEMLNEFFKSMSCFWLGFEQNVSVTPEERANDTREYLKAHKNTQMLVLCNSNGNGVYGDADMALIFNKSKEEIPTLLQSDTAWTVIKRFADGETKNVFNFLLNHQNRSFTSSLIASKCNIELKAAERALDNLLRMKLCARHDIDTDDGVIFVYRAWGTHKLVLINTMLAIAQRLGDYCESYRGFIG